MFPIPFSVLYPLLLYDSFLLKRAIHEVIAIGLDGEAIVQSLVKRALPQLCSGVGCPFKPLARELRAREIEQTDLLSGTIRRWRHL